VRICGGAPAGYDASIGQGEVAASHPKWWHVSVAAEVARRGKAQKW
jgi:hypothetical protein